MVNQEPSWMVFDDFRCSAERFHIHIHATVVATTAIICISPNHGGIHFLKLRDSWSVFARGLAFASSLVASFTSPHF